MNRIAYAALAAVALFSMAGAPARAGDLNTCEDGMHEPVDIDVCTRVIESGSLSRDDLAVAYLFRGDAYAGLGQYARAIQDYDEAIRLDPNEEMNFDARGKAYDHLGQYTRAIQDYDEAIRLEPDNDPFPYQDRGDTEQKMGNTAAAAADHAKANALGL